MRRMTSWKLPFEERWEVRDKEVSGRNRGRKRWINQSTAGEKGRRNGALSGF